MRAHRSKRPTADHLLPATALMRMCEGKAWKQQLQTGARTLCHSIDYQQFGGCCNQTQYLIKLCTTKVPECPRSFRGAVSTTSGETTRSSAHCYHWHGTSMSSRYCYHWHGTSMSSRYCSATTGTVRMTAERALWTTTLPCGRRAPTTLPPSVCDTSDDDFKFQMYP